jgi:hypothetical protein
MNGEPNEKSAKLQMKKCIARNKDETKASLAV